MYPALLYELLHRGTPGDLEFYTRVCDGAARVLELGCGYGRVLAALAQPERRLVGIDVSPGLLERARTRVGEGAELILADMRHFDLRETFDRVLVPYCGLFCLLSDEDVQACLQMVRRHLAPGGQLALDAYVGETFLELEPPEDADEMVTEVVTIHDGTRLWRVFERSTYDPEAQRLDVVYVHVPDDGGEPVEGQIPQRFLTKPQIEAHLAQAGFRIQALCGGYADAPYDEDGDMWSLVATAAD